MCLQHESNLAKEKGNNLTDPSMESSNELDHETVEIMNSDDTDEYLSTITSKSTDHQPISPHSSTPSLYAVFPPNSPTLTVRNGPGTNHGISGQPIPSGTIIEALPSTPGLDRTPVTWATGFGWVQLNNSNNWVAGWQGTEFSNSGFSHLLAAHARSFIGIISSPTEFANMRSGPGTEFDTTQIGSLMSLPQNTRITITHLVARNSVPWSHTIPARIDTQVWLRFSSVITISNQTIQGVAWVRADLVGNLPNNFIPVSSPILDPRMTFTNHHIVMSPTLNLRSGPGTHTQIIGGAQLGDYLMSTSFQVNRTEERRWIHVRNSSWAASENTIEVEPFWRNFHVVANPANIRNAPDVSGTTIIGTISAGTILRTIHRRRVSDGMDWFGFDHTINGQTVRAWIADVNGFVEGEVGSPGIPLPPNPPDHPYRRIDSTRVSMRNPDYNPNQPFGDTRPFYRTRPINDINQIIAHHTANLLPLSRIDLEVGWRSNGWWNGGYHEIIHADGTVEICYTPDVITNGAFGHNPNSYHIAYIGHSNPTDAQIESMRLRINYNMRKFGILRERVFGHGELVATDCPGVEMSVFLGEPTETVGQFVVVTNGLHNPLRIRTEPHSQRGRQVGYLEVGSLVNVIDIYNHRDINPWSDEGTWGNIGTGIDQWANIRNSLANASLPDINMIRVTAIPGNRHMVIVSEIGHAHARIAPGTAFEQDAIRLNSGTNVLVTHTVTVPSQLNGGHVQPTEWSRLENGRWVASRYLRMGSI